MEKEKIENTIVNDSISKLHIPLRRFCARVIDLSIYRFIVSAFLRHVLNVNTSIETGWKIIETPLPIILMYIIEPVLLSVIGTTLGKGIFGISIKNKQGAALTYDAAKRRSFQVFFYGMGGYFLPTMIWRLWKSYVDCKDGNTLPWEDESMYCVRDKKKWRFAVFVISYIILFFLNILSLLQAVVPKHRVPLTTEEFCENYNQLSKYLDLTPEMKLDPMGNWIDNDGITVMSADGKALTYPQFYFKEENGELVTVSFLCDASEDTFVWAASIKNQMLGAVLAYMGAQEEISLLSDERNEIALYIENHIHESFELTKAGIKMTYTIEYEGYEEIDGMLWPIEGEEQSNSYEFKMEKVE